jgi:hypothetical protein
VVLWGITFTQFKNSRFGLRAGAPLFAITI